MAYQKALAGEPHEFTPLNLSTASLKANRDRADKNRQLSYVGIVAVHGLIALEAFVDANLKYFEVSDELTLKIKPEIIFPSSPFDLVSPGVGLVLVF